MDSDFTDLILLMLTSGGNWGIGTWGVVILCPLATPTKCLGTLLMVLGHTLESSRTIPYTFLRSSSLYRHDEIPRFQSSDPYASVVSIVMKNDFVVLCAEADEGLQEVYHIPTKRTLCFTPHGKLQSLGDLNGLNYIITKHHFIMLWSHLEENTTYVRAHDLSPAPGHPRVKTPTIRGVFSPAIHRLDDFYAHPEAEEHIIILMGEILVGTSNFMAQTKCAFQVIALTLTDEGTCQWNPILSIPIRAGVAQVAQSLTVKSGLGVAVFYEKEWRFHDLNSPVQSSLLVHYLSFSNHGASVNTATLEELSPHDSPGRQPTFLAFNGYQARAYWFDGSRVHIVDHSES